jgi:hypothetical protein
VFHDLARQKESKILASHAVRGGLSLSNFPPIIPQIGGQDDKDEAHNFKHLS